MKISILKGTIFAILTVSTLAADLTPTYYHAGIKVNGGPRRMTRVAFYSSKDPTEKEASIKKLIFTRMEKVTLSPNYQVVVMDTRNFNLREDNKEEAAYITGEVTISKALNDLSYYTDEKAQTFGRYFEAKWEGGNPIPKSLSVNVTGIDSLVITGFTQVNPKVGNMLEIIVTGVLSLVLIIFFFKLLKQYQYYKNLFIYICPKITVLYMFIADILMMIHSTIYHKAGSILPRIMSLVCGLLYTGLIVTANYKHGGFKSSKAKISFVMIFIIGLVTCLGFYGDNYIMELCYCCFPLMIIFENTFVDIVHYNSIVNLVYIPVKTMMIFVNMIFNDGFYVDVSYTGLIGLLLAPILIKFIWHFLHKKKGLDFTRNLLGRKFRCIIKDKKEFKEIRN